MPEPNHCALGDTWSKTTCRKKNNQLTGGTRAHLARHAFQSAPLALRRAPHGADPTAGAAAGVEEIALVRLEAGNRRPFRHRQLDEHLARLRIDPPDVGVGPLRCAVP